MPTPRPSSLQRIGRYRIVRPLSKGGMALVYEARRESLAGVSPRVAIKLILPEHAQSETFKELFINEARLGASMDHQNLVRIQDFDSEGERFYLVMEYVEGFTLRRMISLCIKHNLRMPASVIAELGRQASDGLHYAHGASDETGQALDLVHRDIKPSNLILTPHGVVKVLDFGISKGSLREERRGSVKGTWGYMAPEQAFGQEVDPTADVFGLATVLYELAALRPMFRNMKKDQIRRLLRDDHAARMVATLDRDYQPLVRVLVRALQRDPTARFESAEAFGRALSALLPDPITARDEVVKFNELLMSLADQPSAPVEESNAVSSMEEEYAEPSGLVSALLGAATLGAAVLGLGVVGVGGLALIGELSERGDFFAPAESTAHVRGAPTANPSAGTPSPPVEVAEIEPAEEDAYPEVEVVKVRVVRPSAEPAEEPGDEVIAEPQAEQEPVAEVDPGEPGILKVAAKQPAEVYIQGRFVSTAPVEQEMPPGRYAVSLVAPDGRRRTFEVEMLPGKTIRKTWDFDRMEWR